MKFCFQEEVIDFSTLFQLNTTLTNPRPGIVVFVVCSMELGFFPKLLSGSFTCSWKSSLMLSRDEMILLPLHDALCHGTMICGWKCPVVEQELHSVIIST